MEFVPVKQPGRTRAPLIAGVKLTFLAAILAVAGWNLYAAWRAVGVARLEAALQVDWRWSVVAGLGFAGELFASAAAWFWLLRRMDRAGSPAKLYGAYFFSQLGKYVPGKIMLLVMRLERTSRAGVSGAAVTVSTLMENASYLVSGAATAVVILSHFLIVRHPSGHRWLLLSALASMVVLLAAMHPAVFYRLLNPILRRFGSAGIAAEDRLSMKALLASVAMLSPCWVCGGVALWATMRCLIPIGIDRLWELILVFALSVLAGMVSFLPLGLGVRDGVQALFLLPVIAAVIPGTDASLAETGLIFTLVVLLQRVIQIGVEAALSLLGGWLTTRKEEPRAAL